MLKKEGKWYQMEIRTYTKEWRALEMATMWVNIYDSFSYYLNLFEVIDCLNKNNRDFPGGTVVKTPHSQCRGSGFDPWPGD